MERCVFLETRKHGHHFTHLWVSLIDQVVMSRADCQRIRQQDDLPCHLFRPRSLGPRVDIQSTRPSTYATMLMTDNSNNSDSRCHNPKSSITDNGRKLRCDHGSYQDSSFGLYCHPRPSHINQRRTRTGIHDRDFLQGDLGRT
jgi:hypothetical protein